jgi:hypothetical protein
MRFLFAGFLVTILVLGCNSHGSYFQNAETLTEEQFIVVYEDILVLEDLYKTKFGLPANYKDALDKSCEKTFRKHHITKVEFEKAYEFYAKNPEKLKEIQEKIIARLNKKKL